jgi:HSP20 family protein
VEIRPDTWVPAIEVAQRGDHIDVLVELPGIEWMDVRVELIGDRLVVQGERPHDVPSDVIPRTLRRSERKYGHFYREIELPEVADVNRIEAKLNNGMLRITIPLSGKQATARRLPIQTTSSSSEELR